MVFSGWYLLYNDLNPFQDLKYLFEYLPNADIQRHPEHLDDVLPWNKTIHSNLDIPSLLIFYYKMVSYMVPS